MGSIEPINFQRRVLELINSLGTQFKFVIFTMELGNFLLKVKTFAFLKEISTHALNAQQCPCYALYAMFSTVSFVG